ncbi:chalcone-flavanone isomerase-domain-containing protein [Mycotypha africana]|uniref:chalcone-flavanone isomerase-domain-containing protein n=1 Tax=Mycotypha africana TaxID=64632 RepID=UPI0023002001|nr:chalcone-flavanone isomerase-domain-containing protein [Mycotypha africana]KAI8975387.1 chalcone-flavanone isomerase-domain-containing protein [Mycotypha africana]
MFRPNRNILNRLSRLNIAQKVAVTRTVTTTTIAQKTAWTSSKANRIVAYATLGAAGLATASYFNLTNPVYNEAPPSPEVVEDPATKLLFPVYLETDSVKKQLIGLGVRTVSFMNMNVYVVGMYMVPGDISQLAKLSKWKNFDKSKILESDECAEEFLEQPFDLTIRLVPSRSTNTQHLRDGFVRILTQRMRDQDLTEDEEKVILKAIQEFKSNFVSMRVKKDSEFIFTKTREGGLKMIYEGRHLGTVEDSWLAKNFFMCYLNSQSPSSQAALNDFASGFEKLLK